MPKLDYRKIEKDPARCGGQPVVAGTRIRVATILRCYRRGMSVEEIVQQYAPLKPADNFEDSWEFGRKRPSAEGFVADWGRNPALKQREIGLHGWQRCFFPGPQR